MQDNVKIDDDILHGKALKIYWFLLSKGESGIRDIQRNLDFSTPSLVHYQINKLVSLGLVQQNQENVTNRKWH